MMESFSKKYPHRRIRVLAGPADWCRATAQGLLETAGPGPILWLGEDAPAGVLALTPRDAQRILGQEFPVLVVDAHAGLDPQALGATSGTVVGGGTLLLLTPPLERWGEFPDPQHARIAVAPLSAAQVSGRFLDRLARVLTEQQVAIHTPNTPPPPLDIPIVVGGGQSTPDQQRAVATVLRMARGRRGRPLVLTAHRGRGKSAALGLAAAELLQQPGYRVLVTAPRREHAARLLAHAGHPQAHLEFWPPDALLRESTPADLLLVDEAAAIPTPLLATLLERYRRIAFATTVHGYEGSGRGFAIRFREILDRRTPGWRALNLETPIRWAADDPLERLIFRMLLLDAEPVDASQLRDAEAGDCHLEALDPASLARDETTLTELFGLLVQAHYQTTPLDLRYLLDGPNVGGFLLRWRRYVVGVVLTTREGRLDPTLARAVRENRRRPRGHLLPQTIAAHLGREEAMGMAALRVMRIAVHPALRRRGLGGRLLEAVLDEARAQGMDLLGSGFGASQTLLSFWTAARMLSVRLGFHRDAASGAHGALVLRGISAQGKALAGELRQRFLQTLPALLADPLRDLEPDLAAALLLREEPPADGDSPADRRDLEDFLAAHRHYEDTLLAVRNAVLAHLGDPRRANRLESLHRDALILRVVQQHPWSTVAQRLGVAGKARVQALIRQGLATLLNPVAPASPPDPPASPPPPSPPGR